MIRKMAAHPRFNFPRAQGLNPDDFPFPFPMPNGGPIPVGIPNLIRYSQVHQGVDLIRASVLNYILDKIVVILDYSAVTSITQCAVTRIFTVTITCRSHREPNIGFTVSKGANMEGMLINYFLCLIVLR